MNKNYSFKRSTNKQKKKIITTNLALTLNNVTTDEVIFRKKGKILLKPN